jgi:hypothetical protein
MKSKEKTKGGKGAKVKDTLPQPEAQGFLLPKEYKMRIRWRENPLFRATFLILLLTLTWVLLTIPRWFFLDQQARATADLEITAQEESEWVQASLTKIRPLRTKYKEIEEILRYRRLPVAPILSALQRNIPKENISINSINWESNLEKTTKNIEITGRTAPGEAPVNHTARRGTLRLEIYATPEWASSRRSPAGWMANVEKDLSKAGMIIRNRQISEERLYTPNVERNEAAKGKPFGRAIEITLTIELDGPKIMEANKYGKKRPVTPPPPSQVPGDAPPAETPNP